MVNVASNGICGSVSGTIIYDSNNSGDSLFGTSTNICASGSVSGFTYSTALHKWTWTCMGSNSGTNMSCSASETYCGDSIVQTGNGEQCELSQTGCNSSCRYDTPVCNGILISPNPVYALQTVTISASGSVWAN